MEQHVVFAKAEESREPIRCKGVFRLNRKDYPNRKRTTIVITDSGDDVHVAVTATARVYEQDDGGNIVVHEEQYGDIRTLRDDAPIGCLFDSLKEMFDSVPEIIDRRTGNGDKA